MDKFYTTKEFAEILSVSSRTVLNMINTGKIRAVIVGGEAKSRKTYRIYSKELDRFMAENYQRLEESYIEKGL
tara:strand:+ start:519 stop:737 length:219 start_codon:yes stop_codon:yes gene_type:complete